jgi:hypothetical protein
MFNFKGRSYRLTVSKVRTCQFLNWYSFLALATKGSGSSISKAIAITVMSLAVLGCDAWLLPWDF